VTLLRAQSYMLSAFAFINSISQMDDAQDVSA